MEFVDCFPVENGICASKGRIVHVSVLTDIFEFIIVLNR